MAISSVADVVQAYEQGRYRAGSVARKSRTWSDGTWYDLTMVPSMPPPWYYASTPLAFAPMAQSTHGGWDVGLSVAPLTKYLKRLSLTFTQPCCIILVDVLGYYPFVSMSAPGTAQFCDNTATLPARAGNGDGVRMFAMCAETTSQLAGQGCIITYTSSAGVAGRTSEQVLFSQFVGQTEIMHGRANRPDVGHFIGLQNNDKGVRSVSSIKATGAIDIGLFNLVLCKPICTIVHLGPSTATFEPPQAPTEYDFLRTQARMPVIDDDACVSAIMRPFDPNSFGATGALTVDFDVVWG